MTPFTFISELKAISGTNDKLDFFVTNKTSVIERIFHLALSSEYVFGIKKIPLYVAADSASITLCKALDMIEDEFATNNVTGNARVEMLREILESVTADTAEIIKMVITKKLDCGISTTNANKVMDNPIPTFDVLLCSKQDQKLINKLPFPGSVAQTKMDGMRVIISIDKNRVVRYRTRNGKEFELASKYNDYFKQFPGNCFDGEMLVSDTDGYLDRKAGNGLLNSIRQGKAYPDQVDRVRFVLWDLIDYDHYMTGKSFVPYNDRYESLYTLSLEAPAPSIWKIVETIFPKSFEEAQQFYLDKRADGQEGTILKNLDCGWQAKRVNHQIKMKAEETLDLRVIGYQEGTGKYAGMLGALELTDESGKLRVFVGSGFNDEQRKTIKKDIIGSIIEVKYNEIITNKADDSLSLFLPIFVDIRDDKTTGDSV